MRLQRQFGRAVVMIGGFGGSGAPIELIDRFAATGHPTGLTVVNNKAGNGHSFLAARNASLPDISGVTSADRGQTASDRPRH